MLSISFAHCIIRFFFSLSFAVEYANSMSRFVEPTSMHKYDASVRDSMYVPRPPEQKGDRQKQGKGVEISIQVGEGQRDKDLQAKARREFR